MESRLMHQYVQTASWLHSGRITAAVDVDEYLEVMRIMHSCQQLNEADLLRRLLRISAHNGIAAGVIKRHGLASAKSSGVTGDFERAAWQYYLDHSDNPVAPHQLISILRIVNDSDDGNIPLFVDRIILEAKRNDMASELLSTLEKLIMHQIDNETFAIDPAQATEILAWQDELDAIGIGDDDRLRELYQSAPAGADTTLLAAYLREI